jgi:hypothetical protein
MLLIDLCRLSEYEEDKEIDEGGGEEFEESDKVSSAFDTSLGKVRPPEESKLEMVIVVARGDVRGEKVLA